MKRQSKTVTYVSMLLLFCFLQAYCNANPIPVLPAATPEAAPALVPDVTVSPAPLPKQQLPDSGSETQSPAVQSENAAGTESTADEELNPKDKQAAEFEAGTEAIVMKHIDSYFKNGGKGTIGIYVRELRTGYEFGYNDALTNSEIPEEGYFKSASTCKLMSAAVIYYLNNNGELKLDEYLTDKITGSRYCLKQLIPKMISHSVNGYFNITLRQLGSGKINDILQKLGVRNSRVFSEIMPAAGTSISSNIKRYGISKSPRTNPRDLGHILCLLYEGKAFGEENSKVLTEALKANIYSNRLPQGIGCRSPVGHKTGTSADEGVYNDAGIIYLEGNPYIMVVMSKDSTSSVQSVYRRMAAELYDYVKGRVEL